MAKKKTHNDIFDYPFLNRRSFQAYATVLFFLQGKLAFTESIVPLSRGGFKTKEERSKFRHLLFEYIEKKYGPFELYGRSFFPASGNYLEAVQFIDEVIRNDQYQTNLIKDGDVVIDAGANIGAFSIKVAHELPMTKIYSFDPTPSTFVTLKKNTESYSNISCFNLGLGSEATKKKLAIWDHFPGSNSVDSDSSFTFGEKADRVEEIQITTIDEFAKGLPRVDFIKMDTEGYEANILKGAAETIKRWNPIIAMSAYHHPNDKEYLPALLKSICPDYVCELRHDAEEDLICQVMD